MDPLSVASSVVGLLAVAGKIVTTLTNFASQFSNAPTLIASVREETQSLSAIFRQLQGYLLGAHPTTNAGNGQVFVEQILTTLTGCVTTFSCLEKELDEIEDATGKGVGAWTRARWTTKEPTIRALFLSLGRYKASLTLMLTILNCESMREIQRIVESLHSTHDRLLSSDSALCSRMGIEPSSSSIIGQSQTTHNSTDTITIHSRNPVMSRVSLNFENTLVASRVYTKTHRNNSTSSFKSVRSGWTQLSAVTIDDISKISVLGLPLLASDLYKMGGPWYKFDGRYDLNDFEIIVQLRILLNSYLSMHGSLKHDVLTWIELDETQLPPLMEFLSPLENEVHIRRETPLFHRGWLSLEHKHTEENPDRPFETKSGCECRSIGWVYKTTGIYARREKVWEIFYSDGDFLFKNPLPSALFYGFLKELNRLLEIKFPLHKERTSSAVHHKPARKPRKLVRNRDTNIWYEPSNVPEPSNVSEPPNVSEPEPMVILVTKTVTIEYTARISEEGDHLET